MKPTYVLYPASRLVDKDEVCDIVALCESVCTVRQC
jgi:hypothetical protein